jgi:hypothetical protein
MKRTKGNIRFDVDGVRWLTYDLLDIWSNFSREIWTQGDTHPSFHRADFILGPSRSRISALIDNNAEMTFKFMASGNNTSDLFLPSGTGVAVTDNLAATSVTTFTGNLDIQFQHYILRGPLSCSAPVWFFIPTLLGARGLLFNYSMELASSSKISCQIVRYVGGIWTVLKTASVIIPSVTEKTVTVRIRA